MSMPRAAGLFAGIGGIELGLKHAGFETVGLCEFDDDANAVLDKHFPNTKRWIDVRNMKALPKVEVVSAGFPCQDLSLAGRKQGISGTQSSLVEHVFRLLDGRSKPDWLVLENVWYMLRLDRGAGMDYLVSQLEARGMSWAYRVVDSRAFGLPQRRQRVILVASRKHDPKGVLFADDAGVQDIDDTVGDVDPRRSYGFYWTEGLRGLGWTRSAVPTVKGGSKLGIPSPPAIYLPDSGLIGTPSIADTERLQGFPVGWTEQEGVPLTKRNGPRWRLLGNAVSVPVAEWVGARLQDPGVVECWFAPLVKGSRWPSAAWGDGQRRFSADVSLMPFNPDFELRTFLQDPLTPLSVRAASGFLSRARRSTALRFPHGFLDAVEKHIQSPASDVA